VVRRALGRLLVGTPAQFYSVYSGLEICCLAFSLLLARRRDNRLDLSADSPAVAADSGSLADGSDGRDLHLEVLNLPQVGNVATIFLSSFSLHRHVESSFFRFDYSLKHLELSYLSHLLTPLTFEQARIRAELYVGREEKLRVFLRKPLANQRNVAIFFLPPGKACKYLFDFFVPSSQASFTLQVTQFSCSSPLSFTS
jgi:hypothetical protein